MTVNRTTLLDLPLPVTGTESGTWGDVTNNGLTQYLDIAIAGALSVTSSTTLGLTEGDSANTNIASTTAQYRTLLVPASGPSANIVITAPASNRTYHVVNLNATYTVQVRAGAGTGVTIGVNQSATVAYNGTDYALVGPIGPVVPVANGGTGQTSYTNGQLLIGNTTGNTLTKATLTAGTGISITNGTGSISIAATNNGTVTSVATGTGLTGGPITSTGTVSVAANGITNTLLRDSAALSVIGRSANSTGDPADIAAGTDHQVLRRSGTSLGFGAIALNQAAAVTGTLPVGNGGTGATSLTANNVILGNGASAVQFVAPGTSGNVLTSNGTTWASAAAASLNTPLAVVGNNTAGAEIRLPEDTDNGSNYVALKAANSIASNVTFTLPSADGTNGQAIVTNGSGVLSFATAGSPEVKTPTNVSPTNAATDIGETPALTGSTYYSLYGITMAAAQWQVSTVSDFASTVVDTGDVAGTSVTFTVTAGVLSTSTTYYWRVRYKDSDGSYSDFSTGTSFTTAASFGPTVIGQSFGGGFYAGKINQSGTEYYLIVAPKSSGENSSKQWKTTNTTTSGTTSVIDGPTNSANMNNATHPAAQFCEGLSIGGFSDWYMPAKDELEVCYYNLKPTTTANSTASGTNTNAVPARNSNYTTGDPAQTSANDFKTGNSEAFAADLYWSSTEFSATSAWRQNFTNGSQGTTNTKDFSSYVRAVRRVAV